MAFKEVEPGMWNPQNDGDQITGVFVKSESEVGANKSMLYHLEVDKKPVGVWGSTVLDQRMTAVKPGNLIRITYKGLGEKKTGKNPPKIFKLEVDDGNQEQKVPVVTESKFY